MSLAARPFGRVHEARWSISLPEWRVLIGIHKRPGVSGSELSAALGLDKMAISRAVRVLERAGHVTRSAAPGDVRRQALRCTPQGEELCQSMAPHDRQLEHELLGALSPEETAQLVAMLDRLVDRAREAAHN
ncbi:MarR family winged helix-turn-helix transcriptional regulator [Humitalea sp. 24SJ18S-53]|uniref:MarR family winged helix-turn-helix transcriptional regulator n=1 Tax=Humitalea sp. 24SJ18S-53 TaxID=3422307 RepID=UPI003D66E31A